MANFRVKYHFGTIIYNAYYWSGCIAKNTEKPIKTFYFFYKTFNTMVKLFLIGFNGLLGININGL